MLQYRYTLLRFFLLILLFSSGLWLASAQEKEVWFVADLNVVPYSYGFLFPLNSFKVNFSGLLGLKKGRYINGVELWSDLFFSGSQDDSYPLEGSRFHAGLLWDNFYDLSRYMQIKWGMGGFWLRDSFAYAGEAPELNDLIGVTLVADFIFLFPWKYINLQISNKIDLIYDFDAGFNLLIMDPGYTGGVRLNIKPGAGWLGFYLQAAGVYWSYSAPGEQVDTFMLQFAAGVNLDTSRFKNANGVEENPRQRILREAGKKYPDLLPLKDAALEDEIELRGIFFEENMAVLLETSLPVLDALADWLNADLSLRLAVSAYAEYAENPKNDYALYMARTTALRTYLAARGIAPERVAISEYGILYTASGNLEGKILLKIIGK